MSDLVRNPPNKFSYDVAHLFCQYLLTCNMCIVLEGTSYLNSLVFGLEQYILNQTVLFQLPTEKIIEISVK